jgi:hypothetical protein
MDSDQSSGADKRNGETMPVLAPMPRYASIPALSIAALLLIPLSGCHKQPKPQSIVPPPTFPQSVLNLPPVQPLPPPGVAAVPPPPPDTVGRVQTRPVKPRSRTHPGDKRNTTVPAATNPASNGNGIGNGNSTTPSPGTSVSSTGNSTVAHTSPPRITSPSRLPDSGGSIAPVLAHSDEAHQRATTAQLVQSTEDNLRALTRSLSEEDKSVVEQIRNFVAQSRTATSENDFVRAHNLALKAHLLSDELVRQ